jgi:hypothetical protein
MKLKSIKTLSFFSIFALVFTLIYSLSSCSENNEVENVNTIDKTNSMEYKNSLFFPQNDGSILKYENNKPVYGVALNTEIGASLNTNSRNNSDSYRISNLETGEYIDIVEIVEENDYFKFNAITSTGEQINDVKYYGDDFITSLENYTNENNSRGVYENEIQYCGPCVVVVVSAIVAIVDSLQDSPLEQCRGAMQALSCPSGSRPYMQFSEGWFSTTCNVGCR